MIRESIAKFFKVDNLISHLTGYIETRVELLKVEAKEEAAKGLSNVLVFFMLAFVFALVVVFLSVAIGLQVADKWGNFAGFAIVAGFYLIVGVVLLLNREGITKNLEKQITIMLNKKKK